MHLINNIFINSFSVTDAQDLEVVKAKNTQEPSRKINVAKPQHID